jgi:hypothetical protein
MKRKSPIISNCFKCGRKQRKRATRRGSSTVKLLYSPVCEHRICEYCYQQSQRAKLEVQCLSCGSLLLQTDQDCRVGAAKREDQLFVRDRDWRLKTLRK